MGFRQEEPAHSAKATSELGDTGIPLRDLIFGLCL